MNPLALHLFQKIREDLMNAVCPKLLLPESFSNYELAGLLACSILDAFPFRLGTVALEISRTLSELTAAVSAQDFHLIPFSLITPRDRGEHQIRHKDIYFF